MKSIVQSEKECFICRTTTMLEEHHIFGAANRKWSEKYGLKVYLCKYHHIEAHNKRSLNLKLKKVGQACFENVHGDRAEFMAIFGRNYLD